VRALTVGFALAIVMTAGGVALLHALGQVPEDYLGARRPLTSFVSRPDVFSVVVALLAGIAGTVSLTSARSRTLVGVFISVTAAVTTLHIQRRAWDGVRRRAHGPADRAG